MQKIYLWIIFYACHGIIGTLGSSSVDCNYGNGEFWVVGYKYRCYVSNNLNISSPESAIIDAVNGTHKSGKSNNDEIYFHARDKHIEYFPRGLEKFFTNLTGIVIWGSQLKEIHQEDLKPYTKLKYFNIGANNIEVIEDGLFDFQPDIEVIVFDHSKIFHISSTVFDNSSKLTTLSLYGNNCTDNFSKNNRKGVLEIIKSVKSNCTSSDYIKLDEKLKNLEQSSKNLNADNFGSFQADLENIKEGLKNSAISNSQTLKSRIALLSETSILLNLIDAVSNSMNERNIKIENSLSEINSLLAVKDQQIMSIKDDINTIKNSLSESKNQSSIRNQWMIIATGVIAFTQTILFVVIYIEFIQ